GARGPARRAPLPGGAPALPGDAPPRRPRSVRLERRRGGETPRPRALARLQPDPGFRARARAAVIPAAATGAAESRAPRVFDGREVRLPVVVRDAVSGAATYLVSAAAARRLLPGPEPHVLQPLPGRAALTSARLDY